LNSTSAAAGRSARAREARERLVEAVERLQRAAAVAVSGGGVGIALQGGVDLANRLGMIAALVTNDAEQVQAVEMMRLYRNDFPVDRLGFGQQSGFMKGERLSERGREVGRYGR
jgi:hypothetical protein